MEIQSIRSLKKPESIALQMMTSSTPVSSSASTSRSSWRKFASDTIYRYEGSSVDVDADLTDFYEQMQNALDAERYDEVLKGLDVILDRHWAAMNGLVRAAIMTLKSKCYAELDQIDLALVEMDNAVAEIKNHENTIDEFIDAVGGREAVDPMGHLQLRKAALLLLAGKEGEAFALLRDNQPNRAMTVLLYHLLEKECKISLLDPKPISDENDLRDLFFAGRYEEVIEKTKGILSDSSDLFFFGNTPVRLRMASLIMLGRTEEAMQYYNEVIEHNSSFDEEDGMVAIIQALDGDFYELARHRTFEEEFTFGFPVQLFAEWLLNRQS